MSLPYCTCSFPPSHMAPMAWIYLFYACLMNASHSQQTENSREAKFMCFLFTVGPLAPGKTSVTVFWMVELHAFEFGSGVCVRWVGHDCLSQGTDICIRFVTLGWQIGEWPELCFKRNKWLNCMCYIWQGVDLGNVSHVAAPTEDKTLPVHHDVPRI